MNQTETYNLAIRAAAEVSGYPANAWTDPSRRIEGTRLRWALWYHLKMSGWACSEIGRASGYDRTNVNYGVARIEWLIENPNQYDIDRVAVRIATDEQLRQMIQDL